MEIQIQRMFVMWVNSRSGFFGVCLCGNNRFGQKRLSKPLAQALASLIRWFLLISIRDNGGCSGTGNWSAFGEDQTLPGN
jgi:hypothetical protein